MYRMNPSFVYEKLEDGMVVYDAIRGKTHILNETAATVVRYCGEQAAIMDEFGKVYSLHRDTNEIKHDVELIVNRLLGDKILINEDEKYV